MSRRRPASGATISLFPFLAVLLCTMGALLVLLVIFSRRAKETENAVALEAERARCEELETAREDLRWRLEQLHGVRTRTEADLARERMRLAGVEEDARKLADEIDALERTAEVLERSEPAADTVAAADAERRLDAARAALDEARKEGAKRPAAYAVVPYEGANGTHRRPLYVECCIDGVFLQPEGIRLGPADFEGPPGPGNPLASALRAAREHLARNPGEQGDPAAQPYPLLLVRPAGVMAYYAAREALVSWGSEFGYQLVDEDWELTYPPADPALAAVEQRAVDESRRRLEWLAQVRPVRAARPTQQFRAAPTSGGVVAEGGPSVLGDQSRFDWTEEQAARGGRRGGGDGTATSPGDGSGSGDVVLGNGGRGDGGRSGSRGGGGAGPGTGAAPGGRYVGPSRFYSGEAPTNGAAIAGPGGPATGGAAGGDSALAGAPGGRPDGASGAGQARGGSGAGDASASAGDMAAAAGGAGGSSATGGGGGAAAAGGATGGAAGSAGMAGGGGGASGGPTLPGMPQASGGGMSAAGAGGASGSLAGSRGSNWASLATAARPIPVTRPIRVECAANEFRIHDDAGSRVETRIPIGTSTADAVDPLVQAIHSRVGRWGLAGERMYWRPELVLSETVDGGARREELERLLADSGLDTRRERPDTQVRLLPPVTRTSAVAPVR